VLVAAALRHACRHPCDHLVAHGLFPFSASWLSRLASGVPVAAPTPPSPGWAAVVLALLLPAVLCAILTPLVIRLAVRLNLIDRPGGRKIHPRPVPMLGGLAIAGAVLITLPVLFATTNLGDMGYDVPHEVLALAAGGLVALLVGFVDELRDLPAGLHFLGQLLAAGTAVVVLQGTAMVGPWLLIGKGPNASTRVALLDPIFSLLHIHLNSHQIALNSCGGACGTLQTLTVAFVVIWIVAMMNTVNFLDGIDGLAAGVVAIAACVLALLAGAVTPVAEGADAILLPLVIAGAALGFLPFNWHPARIFMADTGAQFLGFALGFVALVGGAKLGTVLIVLAVPILDVAWAIARRRTSFGTADRGHLHHRLLDLGLDQRTIVLLYYVPALIFGLASVVLHDWRHKLALLAVLIVVVVLAMVRLTRASKKPVYSGK
jgi:UDP-N-acetylmuramyl pentapeptide phosphotransferase/UDP-N-acetylglucosamine-1-phosphate transferase